MASNSGGPTNGGDQTFTTAACTVTPPTGTDFDGDDKADIVWRHTSGAVAVWLMNGTAVSTVASLGAAAPSWVIQ